MQQDIIFIFSSFLFLCWHLLACFIFAGINKAATSKCTLHSNPTFSIIIATRSVNSSLIKIINTLQQQNIDPGRFELILVFNNCQFSDVKIDELKSASFLNKIIFSAENSDWSSKKNALWQGALTAKNDYLIFTDSDCRITKQWLAGITENCSDNRDIIFGYAPIIPVNRSVAGILAEVDSCVNNSAAAAGAGWQKPFMANGRNLIIRRKIYLNPQFMAKIRKRTSGDDDLLVQRMQAEIDLNTGFCFKPSASVKSDAPPGLRQYLLRRGRHISASFAYSAGAKLGFAMWEVSRSLFLLLCVLVGISTLAPYYLLMPVICFTVEWLILRYFKNKCNESLSLWRYSIWLLGSSFVSFLALLIFILAKDKWPNSENKIKGMYGP